MKKICMLLLVMLFSLGACTTGPVTQTPPSPDQPTAQPTVSPSPPTQTPTDSPTEEPLPALKAGQSTFAFYHPVLSQVLLVNGGPERGKPADDPLELWSWDGTRWTLLSADPEGPTWRNWAAIAYDTDRDVLVIHGGLQTPMRGFDETWEWDGNTWSRFTVPGPGAREGSLMVYDAARQSMILFGGAEGMDIQGDTWEWKDGTWSKLSETGPAPRFPGGMVYDQARDQTLLYSGHFASPSGEAVSYDDLWAWDGTSWNQLPVQGDTAGHRTHAAMVFDPQADRVLLFSGGADTFRSDIHAWDGANWTEISTTDMPARSGHSLAYDRARDRFVLFGGIDRPGSIARSDTWEWDRTTWTCVDNC